VGKFLSPVDRFSAHLLLGEPEKATNMGFPAVSGLAADLQYLRLSGHREGSARRIRLIPSVDSRTIFEWHKPLFWGRRIYVSFVWTIHGGSRCYCSYPASRSLCCLSLGLTVVYAAYLVPHAPIFRVGKLRWRSGEPWPLSFLRTAAF
jgi:hypothetical protein